MLPADITMQQEEAQTRKTLAQLKLECELVKNNSLIHAEDDEDDGWCGVVWDNILCWNKTRAATVARLPCPAYITRFTTSVLVILKQGGATWGVVNVTSTSFLMVTWTGYGAIFCRIEFAERICTENGTWWVSPERNSSWTNFSKCVIPPVDVSSHAKQANNLILLYTIGYSVSLVSLIVAVIIMLYSRRLHSKSTTLHINLFTAFILRASLSFMKDRLFINGLGLPHDVREGQTGLDFIQEGIHWECRLLFVLLMFSISASQTWMLMEGLYLYLLVHKTMTTERVGVTPYIILGWVLPWTFLIPWIAVKSIFENSYCWNMQENPAFFWILKAPWTAIVVINFFFFLDIIRVLMAQLRNNQRHAGHSQYKKVGKFILVLIPLFGIMYIVLNLAFPSEVQPLEYNVVYLYIEMGYNSFQGFILALLFCFLNDDVHAEIRRSWQRHRSRRHNSSILKRSTCANSWKKASKLFGTSLPPNQVSIKTSGKQLKTVDDTKTSTTPCSYKACPAYRTDSATPLTALGNHSISLLRHGSSDSCNIDFNAATSQFYRSQSQSILHYNSISEEQSSTPGQKQVDITSESSVEVVI